MNGLNSPLPQPSLNNNNNSSACLLSPELQLFEPQAEDILTDEDLLDLFRIVKQVLRKNPDSEKLAKLLFCMSYALGDHIKFSKPCHDDRILFRDNNFGVHAVRLPSTSSCCSISFHQPPFRESPTFSHSHNTYSVRPYSNFRPLYTAASSSPTVANNTATIGSPLIDPNSIPSPTIQHVVMEPHQRGFYYQDGRIAREPVLLQRYAEQGILTQASLMRKRKRHSADANSPFELSALPLPAKKPKIPHRHGEFEQRRDDIISRMRIISMADLEQKAQRLPNQFTLAIDQSVTTAEGALSSSVEGRQLTQEQQVELLEPALRILTNHSNMKPHLDNGMNQNGIYYNSDYFRLYLAFEQFQRTFAILFPNEVVKVPDTVEDDKDRERNANMKAYRVWIEPLLTETNWAAFRRNIVVGERIMQLTKCIGQGVLLMTKELSGSKLHLTFTNSEWDEFINGLIRGLWDNTIEWEENNRRQLEQGENASLLVSELQLKFATHYWFHSDGLMVSSKERRLAIHATTVASNKNLHRNSMDPSLLLYHNP
ncbi:hypothetical protein EDC94DRAFT_561904 [Helicostylum pulchrum]|nr:hypothetical protein EDC94DRAFT_561904 [Helicostylum pulchrum]